MKSLMCLLQEVLHDRGTWCHVSTSRDLKTVTARVEHEGLSFLTIALPQFGADFQKSLDLGRVAHPLFQGFTWKGSLPRFLGGFFELVFDRATGRLLDDPSVDAIQAIRQITLMFGKVNLPCSDARERAAINKYVQCEQEVKLSDLALTEDNLSRFVRVGNMLWSGVLQQVEESIYYGRLIPRHGPGSTADKLLGNQKYNQTEWTSRLESIFPYGEYCLPNWRYVEYLGRVHFLEPGAERPVQVLTVPKTLKTPRIIAREPTCMMYMQQAISRDLVSHLEGSTNPNRCMIGFSDQAENQHLARLGSSNGELATLDLSEASDRVSNQLVRALVGNFPNVVEGLDATRSRKADVPGKGVIRLAKFASMGSALCFPIEAMVFLTVALVGIERVLNRQLTARDVKSLRGSVRVYGDDIIVPTKYVHSVIDHLETFGFRVNVDKSFWNGKFRESCGKEYYDGHDVSITRVRSLLPTSRKDAPELVSTISFRNQLYLAGYWRVVAALDEFLERLIPFPRVSATSSVHGRHSFLGYETQRVCRNLHRPLVKGVVESTTIPVNMLDDVGALVKYFIKDGNLPSEDKAHLERSGRPKSVGTKLRWASPF